MNLEEIQTVVGRSAKLRAPQFAPDTRLGDKLPRLEDYMLSCAFTRGELEDAWRHVTRAMTLLEEKLAKTEIGLPRPKTIRLREERWSMDDPDNYGALCEARQLRREIERQIARLHDDEKVVSRAYTFITGQS